MRPPPPARPGPAPATPPAKAAPAAETSLVTPAPAVRPTEEEHRKKFTKKYLSGPAGFPERSL